MAKSGSFTKTAVWILLGLLVLGLAGFGATNLGGNIRNIGFVGDKPIGTQTYFMAMRQELQAYQAQTGEPLTFAEARQRGLDQAVLNRLVALRALDHEAAELGLSVGDAIVRDRLLDIPGFKGLDGTFDREAYAFALSQRGMSEAEFESQLRDDVSRTLLQAAIVNGVKMPETFADLLVSYVGERRDFTWVTLDSTSLENDLPEPTEDDLRAYYDAHGDEFMLPEAKSITYAWLTPEMIADSVEIDEDALRDRYETDAELYNRPERRLVERLAFLDEDAAMQAAARLASGEATFEGLVEERGLSLSDIDLGDVTQAELGEAGAEVFATEVGAVTDPLPSDLGPALFRVNGVLEGEETSFEDALPELRESLALDRARRVIEAQAENFNDLLAGGATLEELAAESDMQLGQIDWTERSGEEIAAYEEFRTAAAALEEGDFPEIALLEDGGLFAMRLDNTLPARPQPFDEARDAVAAAIEAEALTEALQVRAETLKQQLENGADFAELGLETHEETGIVRGDFVPYTPANLVTTVFEMEPGELRVVPGAGIVALVRLTSVGSGADDPENNALARAVQQQLDQELAQDLFDIYTNEVALRAGPRIDRQAVEAVNVNFP